MSGYLEDQVILRLPLELARKVHKQIKSRELEGLEFVMGTRALYMDRTVHKSIFYYFGPFSLLLHRSSSGLPTLP